jgi:hypothetical protein
MCNILEFDAIWSGRSYRCFGRMYFLYLQGRSNKRAANINNHPDNFQSIKAETARNTVCIHDFDYCSIVM